MNPEIQSNNRQYCKKVFINLCMYVRMNYRYTDTCGMQSRHQEFILSYLREWTFSYKKIPNFYWKRSYCPKLLSVQSLEGNLVQKIR
jgi:hypothetical protein